MRCPYFVEPRDGGEPAHCVGVAVPFEPSWMDQLQFCRAGRHRSCPLYRTAREAPSPAVQREVARALG